jgi:hypothetical protein
MPSLERPGENAAGSSKGYRNGTYTRESSDSDRPTRRSQRLKTAARASSTRRSLTVTVALNRTSRDPSHPDVRGRNEHSQSRRSGPNVAGSRSQWKSRSVASIRRSPSNLKPGDSVLCKPIGGLCTQDAGPFQYSSRGQGRFHYHLNRLRGGHDRKQRGVGEALVR